MGFKHAVILPAKEESLSVGNYVTHQTAMRVAMRDLNLSSSVSARRNVVLYESLP